MVKLQILKPEGSESSADRHRRRASNLCCVAAAGVAVIDACAQFSMLRKFRATVNQSSAQFPVHHKWRCDHHGVKRAISNASQVTL